MTFFKLRSYESQSSADETFEILFQEHWSRVYGVIFRIVGDPDEAEDIALEVFLKLHEKLEIPGGLTGGLKKRLTKGPLSGWLYRVATNLAFNALRSRKRRQWYELEAGNISLQAASPENPAHVVERIEERQQVRQILSQMKPRSAKILVLRHSGLSYKEIAAAIRVSPNSVGKLLSRAEKDFEQRYRALEGNVR